MNATTPAPARLAGLSAVLAGLCYVGVGLVHPANVAASVTTTPWLVAHLLACATCFFGLLGLTGLHVRQAARTGLLGLVGYAFLSLWFALVLGFSFVEAFVLPRPGLVTPAFVESWMGMFDGTAATVDLGLLPSVWTLTAPLYILGGLAFGAASFRAGLLPRGAAVLLAVGTAAAPVAVLLPLAAQPKTAVPVGVALAWAGYGLLAQHRAPVDEAVEHPSAAAV